MRKYTKIIGLVVITLITLPVVGQTKQVFGSKFTNPFQKKTQQSSSVISPQSNISMSARTVNNKPKFQMVRGSFSVDLKNETSRSPKIIEKNLNNWFDLNEQHSFYQLREKKDELGITHTYFQQRYKGFPIEHNVLILHSKNELVSSLNGRMNEFSDVNTEIKISAERAIEIAKSYLKVSELINQYPIETLITTIPSETGDKNRLAYKIRIDSYSPFVMCHVYVNTNTGEVINKINLIAHADTPGTAQTLYSGTQSITCDANSGSFRLRDNARKIETYDATNATGLTTSGFTGSTDFTNASTTWSNVSGLSSFTISAVAQSWWFTAFADELPELYIKIKDGKNQIVYTSGYLTDTRPPLQVDNLNIILTTPPYTVEIWEFDAVGGDDFGGSYPLLQTVGTQTWSGNGNNGSYIINTFGNPALDVHWGMEKTYDFYLNVLNRKSYDGNGGLIKQYINPPLTSTDVSGWPNNAFATSNVMVYGFGDGSLMGPVVGLDVEGHEFTHIVVDNNGNGGLNYKGESGALNESFADIFGTSIEFYTGVDVDWNIGEGVALISPLYFRSMSNPNTGLTPQPDTYKGQFWKNTLDEIDDGGVHTNSGVQNFWFYLLSEGGSGTNDLGNAYAVSGIGIEKAQQIAYRNLITYLTPDATYEDAYNGSLLAAQDLYGNPSAQYTAVRQAWYAVGIGNDPNSFCSGTTELTASSGIITDGSGIANYSNSANCKWVIAPPGATQITLKFTAFDTEEGNDVVYVYDGPDDTYPLLATWWGNTLPPVITTTAESGAMCIKFNSDNSQTASGWSASYTSIGIASGCTGVTVLSTPSGSFSDGSGNNNYGNNQLCNWFIAPPCAKTVTLSFSQFSTEKDYDGITIFDDLAGAHQLAVLSGTSIPAVVTSTTGIMVVVFSSDYSTSGQGFSASYSSTGAGVCSGVTTLNSADSGAISDGSGTAAYCNNSDCSWLIQPPEAISVVLNFTDFNLEPGSSDGKSIYDAVEVYDGPTTSAPLLGRFTGSNLPPAISSTGGSMLIRFYSDLDVAMQGWSAKYTSTQSLSCSGMTSVLTTQNGSLTDGSGAAQYSNNNNCSWLIQPVNAGTITFTFTALNTELNNDGVIIYDGINNDAPVLGSFSGSTIPASITSKGGSMYIEFLSGPAVRGEGWSANYTSSIITGIEELLEGENLKVFPNPSSGTFTINSKMDDNVKLQILNLLGRQVLKGYDIVKGENQIDASELTTGIYILQFETDGKFHNKRLLIN